MNRSTRCLFWFVVGFMLVMLMVPAYGEEWAATMKTTTEVYFEPTNMITFTGGSGKEVMRFGVDEIWVNPDITTNEAADLLIKFLRENGICSGEGGKE